jgi:hypothetical protein
MQAYEAIPYKFWRNEKTGSTASIYGANPGNGRNDHEWKIVQIGYHIRDNINGMTMKPGCLPFNCSLESAQKYCDEQNKARNERIAKLKLSR